MQTAPTQQAPAAIHYPCDHQAMTGQMSGTGNFRPDFQDEYFTSIGNPIDAPRTMPQGGLNNVQSGSNENVTFAFSFVMRGGA